jgi:hypothetical protein
MLDSFEAINQVDQDGNPSGGSVGGTGFRITWQEEPLGREGVREVPNGAFVETILAVIIDRLEFYEQSPFACEENKTALVHLRLAAQALEDRTRNREARGVEGTHEV